jgi:hypothetical protein
MHRVFLYRIAFRPIYVVETESHLSNLRRFPACDFCRQALVALGKRKLEPSCDPPHRHTFMMHQAPHLSSTRFIDCGHQAIGIKDKHEINPAEMSAGKVA